MAARDASDVQQIVEQPRHVIGLAGDDLPRLVYTQMVIHETLRLYPPAWILARAPLRDDEIGGYHVPAHTIVLLSPYVTHRHPAFWGQPERFEPERFTPERIAARPRFAYFPFSGGHRQCIGEPLALLELHCIVAMIASRYELALLPGHHVLPEAVLTLQPRAAAVCSRVMPSR